MDLQNRIYNTNKLRYYYLLIYFYSIFIFILGINTIIYSNKIPNNLLQITILIIFIIAFLNFIIYKNKKTIKEGLRKKKNGIHLLKLRIHLLKLKQSLVEVRKIHNVFYFIESMLKFKSK